MRHKPGQPRKGPGGRKTKYKPEMLPAAKELTSKGATKVQVAAALNISEASLYEYQLKFPEFAEALEKGTDFAVKMVENAVFREANGFEAEEVRESWVYEKDEKTGQQVAVLKSREVVKRFHRGNPTMAAIYLNAHCPETYQRRPEDGQGRLAEVTLNFTVVNVNGKESAVSCPDFLKPKVISAKPTAKEDK